MGAYSLNFLWRFALQSIQFPSIKVIIDQAKSYLSLDCTLQSQSFFPWRAPKNLSTLPGICENKKKGSLCYVVYFLMCVCIRPRIHAYNRLRGGGNFCLFLRHFVTTAIHNSHTGSAGSLFGRFAKTSRTSLPAVYRSARCCCLSAMSASLSRKSPTVSA
jgi:hypothetical protein